MFEHLMRLEYISSKSPNINSYKDWIAMQSNSKNDSILQKKTLQTEDEIVQIFKDSLEERGDLYLENCYIECRFSLASILAKLGKTEKNIDNKIICPYGIHFLHIIFTHSVDLNNVEYKQDVQLEQITCGQSFNCSAMYNQSFSIGSSVFLQDLICNSSFKSRFSLNEVYILDKAFFSHSKFYDTTRFNNVVFFQREFFNEVSFIKGVTFEKVQFHLASFKNTTFYESCKFVDSCIYYNIWFYDIELNNTSLLRLSNINISSIYGISEKTRIIFEDNVIKGRIHLQNIKVKHARFSNNVIVENGVFSTDNLIIDKCDSWKSALFLKHEALKNSNIIDSLRYQSLEKDSYLKELWKNRQWGDWFSLWLGKIFHNHGQNWWSAFLWTIFILVLSFTCFYLPDPVKYWNIWDYKIFSGIYFSGLFQYLVPTDYGQIRDYFIIKELSFWTKFAGTFWYMLGKMVLPYGVYEVIKAFRKYK